MESQAQTQTTTEEQTQTATEEQTQQEEVQQLQSTPVLVASPAMDEKTVQQSSVWWVNTEDKQRPFFVISKNKHNHDSKTLTGFWLNEQLDKSESRLSVRINFKDMNGKFQQGWVNVTQMTTVSEEDLDKTLGQSTKGFVHKVMDNFTRKIVGGSPQHDNRQDYNRGGRGRQDNRQEYPTHRGNSRGRGGGRGRGSRGRGTYQRRDQENTQQQQESSQSQENSQAQE